jgi:hypothetical protein
MPFYRNEEFVGRYALLESLHTVLCNVTVGQWNHRVALHGMGGVGKTQTAIAYVYKYKDNYDRIYWVSAATEATLLTGFQNIASKTGCVIECDPKKQATAVIRWLQHQEEKCLLVIDNLDDIKIAKDYNLSPQSSPK